MALISIAAAGIAAWTFGLLYYWLLGRPWLAVAGLPAEALDDLARRERADPVPVFLSLAAAMLMAGVLGLIIAQVPPPGLVKGVLVALMLWLGFVATSLSVTHTLARRPLLLTAIDALHWLGALMLMGGVLGAAG